MKNGRVAVVGGSIGGLFAGHLLLNSGWDVHVFERSESDLADRGAGIGVWSELFDVMQRIGLSADRSQVIGTHSSVVLDRGGGNIVREWKRASWSSSWPAIYKPLRAGFPPARYHPGMAVAQIDQRADGVTLRFANGHTEDADLVVAADGINSTIRQQYLPQIGIKTAGYVAWRGVVSEEILTAEAQAVLNDRVTFAVPEGEMILTIHIPGPNNDVRPGHRRFFFIWYRPATPSAQKTMFTDAAGHYHGLSIPPPLIRDDLIVALKKAAREMLPALLADIVEQTPRLLLQSISDLECPRLVFGRVALLGDAAFVARPHVVAGTTKAALDAAALANALEESADLEAALARYERERLEFGRSLVTHSRYLGGSIHLPNAIGESESTKTVDPIQIIANYGARHLLASLDDTRG